MSVVSKAINWNEDSELFINYNRPYNIEKRRLKSLVDFGVTSQYMSKRCLEEFKNIEHREALKMNKGL